LGPTSASGGLADSVGDDEYDLDVPREDASDLDDLIEEQDPPLLEVAEQTAYGEIVLEALIRRQLLLSLSVASVFLTMLFGLPIMNLVFPQFTALSILGLPLSWLLLAVVIYPVLWVLAMYYVATAKYFEDEFAEQVR
jgi:uncharacterized membrane protein (DUF485 family)